VFAAEFGAPNAHGSYEDLAADPSVDAIYIGSPHSEHETHALLCLRAGKHVLCEKPLALNAAQAARMIGLARSHDRVLMEAMWTRFLPAMISLRDQIGAGAIGEVRLIQADFGFQAAFDPESRLFAPRLGGGALLDVGIYPLNLAFMLAGEPVEVQAVANLAPTGVDAEGAVLLRHPEGQLSLLACSFRADTPRDARIVGTDGTITIGERWWAASRYVVHRADGREEVFQFANRGGGYTHEAEAFMDLIRSGQLESAVMPPDESLAILRAMDEIRGRWGVRYPGE
jgi:predicted dehydrogenase